METLVVVTQHRNQYYGKSKSRVRFGSYPSRGFKEINCRTFQSGIGSPPPPPSFFPSADIYSEPKSPQFYSEPSKPCKQSNPIAIRAKPSAKAPHFNDNIEEFAGPGFFKSPPPSSLPIPKFSLRQKRSVSFELPPPSSTIELPPAAKSLPSSPTGDSFSSATESLRRILHLDALDD